MNKIKTLLLSAGLIAPLFAGAKGTVTGKVVESSTGNPMDYVTIQLIDAKTGKPLPIGTNTAEDGTFSLPDVADGEYLLKVTNIGSVPQERQIKIAGEDANVGILRLADDTKVLQEVVVEGVRSQMRFELDKKVFSVDANIVAAGQSASELLESIPSVEVDQDGEVSLRGNSSVTIWINGKDSGLTSDNRAQILEQIPGETIDRIEVITNPSAKYSPEGTAGIINIILKKDRRAGYFGSAEIGGNSRGGGNASANINFNSGKWDTYASLGFRMRHNKGGSLMDRAFDDGTFTRADGRSRNHGNNLFLRMGATYHLTDKDEFSLSGFGMMGHRWGKNTTLYTQNIPGQWLSNLDLSRQHGNNRGAHGELGYSHKWNDNRHIDATVSYNHWSGPNSSSYLEEQTFEGGFKTDDYKEQTMPINVNSFEAKIDYTNQLLKWLKMEAGFNGNYGHEDNTSSTMHGTSPADMILNESLYNRFIYNNNISALYLTLGGKIKDFSFSAGLRGEAWQVRSRSLAFGEIKENVPQFKKNDFALFPSVFLSYSLPHDNELQINYTRRIRRPWGGQLNSFRNISDPTNISYGNPELEPQYTNSFELNYLKTWTYHMISLSAYMREASNMMNRINYMDGDVMYSTWANVSRQLNSGAEIVVKNQFFRILDLTTTANLYNNRISAWNYSLLAPSGKEVSISGAKRNSFAWDIRVMANVRLPWSMSFQATGNYSSKQLEAQGSRQGGWSVDAGVRKTFGNWSLSVNCRDIFDSRRFKNVIDGMNYTEHNERWRGGRRLQLTLKYSFGNMKGKQNRNQQMEPSDTSGYGSEEM